MSDTNISDPELGAFLTRVRTHVDGRKGFQDLSGWLCRNTTLDGKPFSFKDHEFQIEIVDDMNSRLAVKKCSQVGLSELMVRKIGGLLATLTNKRIIFAMPAAKMVNKFSKDRIDSVLNQSDTLRGMVKTANNSAEQKILGTNTLYCTGTWGASSGISVPAEFVIVDELDFCNLEVVSLLYSRIRHATADENGVRGFLYKFSTPTLPGYGVSEAFEQGSQKYYFVKCSGCNHSYAPNYYQDIVVPGHDLDFGEVTKHDLAPLKASNALQSAYIKCPCCGKDATQDLLDPSRRFWVAKHSDRMEASYQVSPWDVPVYNPVPNILAQAIDYKRHGDFLNFVMGLEYEDADNVFLNEPFEQNIQAEWWQVETIMKTVTSFMGVDVGKVLHVTVGVAVGRCLHLTHAAEVANTNAKSGAPEVLRRVENFNCKALCIDAGPDISLVRTVLDGLPFSCQGFAVEYVKKTGLKDFLIDEEARVIKANRTETLSGLMKDHNTGMIQYPGTAPVMATVKTHLKNTKKIRRDDTAGDEQEAFIKTGEDHYAHSMNYLRIAKEVLFGDEITTIVAAPAAVTTLKVGSASQSALVDQNGDPFERYR